MLTTTSSMEPTRRSIVTDFNDQCDYGTRCSQTSTTKGEDVVRLDGAL